MRVLVTGASGMLGRRRRRRAGRPRRRGHRAAAPPVRAGRTGRCSATSPTRPWSPRAVAGQDAVCTWPPRSTSSAGGPSTSGPTSTAPAPSWPPAGAAGVGRLVHVSSPSVAHAGAAAGRRRAPARPTRDAGPRPLRPVQGGRPSCSRWPPTRAELAVLVVRPHLVWGPGDTQLVGRIVAAGPGRPAAADRLRRRADRHDLRRQRRRRAGRGASTAATGCTARRSWSPTASRGRSPRSSPGLRGGRGAARRAAGAAPAGPGGRRRGRGGLGRRRCCAAPGDPPLTRFLAEQLGTAHWFDQRRTREALGWTPRSAWTRASPRWAPTDRCTPQVRHGTVRRSGPTPPGE